MKVVYGNSNPELGRKILRQLKIAENKITIKHFCDGEIKVKYTDNIRGKNVFIIQTTQPPAENLMELLLMIDAAKRASANSVTAVIPYFGYARQDRKDESRVALSAKLVANLITVAGADRVLSLDLHSDAIQGFFDIPFDHVYASWFFVSYIKKLMHNKKYKLVAPDVGASKRTGNYAKWLNKKMVLIDKKRKEANKVDGVTLIGKIEKYQAIMTDDLCDTFGTLNRGSNLLHKKGATNIIAICTHPVLSGNAFENIMASKISQLIVSDTLPLPNNMPLKIKSMIKVVSSADLLARCIKAIHDEKSVSKFIL